MSGIYIPNMTEEEYTELCAWARVGANNCYLGRKECVPVPDHGRLGDLDELEKAMRNRKYYVGRLSDPDYLVADAPTIIPAEEGE